MVYFSKRGIKRKRKRRVKEPLTEDLLDELLSAPDPVKFAGKHRLHGRDLPSYLQQLLDEKGLVRPEVVRQAGLNPVWLSDFRRQRKPSRNKLLQLAFAMSCTLRKRTAFYRPAATMSCIAKTAAMPLSFSASAMARRCKLPMSSCTRFTSKAITE